MKIDLLNKEWKFHKNINIGIQHIKYTVKGDLIVNYWKIMTNLHNSLLNNTLYSSFCKKIKFDSFFNNLPDYTNAILNHCYLIFN